jgi:hypothetical protein
MTKCLHNKIMLLLLPALVFIMACSKEQCDDKQMDKLTATATVINTGSIALDGCGWLIKIGTTNYAPDNLSENFKLDNNQVKIVYTISDVDYICGWGRHLKYIHLYDIKK